MTSLMNIVGHTAVILGALVFATAALGIIRFPDAYTRISAVGTAGGFGIILIIIGALFLDPTLSNLIRGVVVIILHLATSAIGSISIARSAYLTRSPLNRCWFNDLESPQPDETG